MGAVGLHRAQTAGTPRARGPQSSVPRCGRSIREAQRRREGCRTRRGAAAETPRKRESARSPLCMRGAACQGKHVCGSIAETPVGWAATFRGLPLFPVTDTHGCWAVTEEEVLRQRETHRVSRGETGSPRSRKGSREPPALPPSAPAACTRCGLPKRTPAVAYARLGGYLSRGLPLFPVTDTHGCWAVTE